MKLGLKIGSLTSPDFVEQMLEHIDFIEAYAHPDADYSYLSNFDKPVTVHVTHSDHGTNFCNGKIVDHNKRELERALMIADSYQSEVVVFHPALYENEDCYLENIQDIIGLKPDPRLHLENMPYNTNGKKHMACSPAEVERFVQELGVKFCLDFAHAFEYLKRIGADSGRIVEYLNLTPNHFHVTDANLDEVFDPEFDERHTNFGNGSIDLNYIRKLLPPDCWATIETPNDIIKNVEEFKYIRN